MTITPEELRLIGGSDVSALVGLNPHKGPFDLYSRIVDGVVDPESKAMRRGTLMEPVIRAMVAEDFEVKLLGPEKHRLDDWGRANLDDVIAGESDFEVAEFKSVSPFAAQDYGESGTDEVPEYHLVQVQMYLWVKRVSRAQLFALLGLDDLRRYFIVGDSELQEALIDSCRRFWRDHIVPKKPPPIDATQACSDWLARRFPVPTREERLAADMEADLIASRLKVADQQIKAAEAIKRECRNLLAARIGEAPGMNGNGWGAAYFTKKGSTKTDWEAVAKLANAPAAFVELHTVIGKPTRELRVTFKKGGTS